MRHLFILATVALLGISPLVGGRLPAAAQEGATFEIITTEDVPWERVSRPRPVDEAAPEGGAGTLPIEKLQEYEVYFDEESAAVPVVDDAEFMLVAVQQGTFVLDLAPEGSSPSGPGTFLVHPSGGAPIPTMERTDNPEPGPFYEATGLTVLDAVSNECTSMCLIPVEVAVQVKPGDRIVAREGAICLWCLLNQTPEDEKGLLLVTPVVPVSTEADQFSWITSWDASAANAETKTVHLNPAGTASMSNREAAKMGWAFFNPGPGCHRGPGS